MVGKKERKDSNLAALASSRRGAVCVGGHSNIRIAEAQFVKRHSGRFVCRRHLRAEKRPDLKARTRSGQVKVSVSSRMAETAHFETSAYQQEHSVFPNRLQVEIRPPLSATDAPPLPLSS
jgi:hypothetical protein